MQSNETDFEETEFDPGKPVRFRVVAELVLGENEIYEDYPVEKTVIGEYIKIKSGLYENLLGGWVLSVEKLPDNTEATV